MLRTHWLIENSRLFHATHWTSSCPAAADFYFMSVSLICLNSLNFWDVLAKNSWLSRQILMHRRRVWLHHIILGLEKAIKLSDEIWRFDRVVSVRKTEKNLEFVAYGNILMIPQRVWLHNILQGLEIGLQSNSSKNFQDLSEKRLLQFFFFLMNHRRVWLHNILQGLEIGLQSNSSKNFEDLSE